MKPIRVILNQTRPNFYGTSKSYWSHCNKLFSRCYSPSLTKYKLFMHFNIHKSYSETFACLGLEIRLQMKKLQFKRWFYTVFQESHFDSVTWKTFNNIVQNWFLNKLEKFSQHSWNGMSYLKSDLWQRWLFASRQTATIPFEILQIVTVWHLLVCSEYPLDRATG